MSECTATPMFTPTRASSSVTTQACRKSPPPPPYSVGMVVHSSPASPALRQNARGVMPSFSHCR
jgi:hypothetical protein